MDRQVDVPESGTNITSKPRPLPGATIEVSLMFEDRTDAGRRLAGAMGSYAHLPGVIVLGIPRGGVVVAAEVARILGVPLDIVVASKLGAPGNPEYAVGAIDADGEITLDSRVSVSEEYLRSAVAERGAEIARRLETYRGKRPPLNVRNRTVLLVDDGIATGLTVRAAIGYLRRHGAGRIVVAAPVMPPETAAMLGAVADEVVALETPRGFSAVGQFYVDFAQTSDAEVIGLLSGPQ